MRIIGEIPHEKYKITVLGMNNKVTIQLEDRQVTQSFTFRDGSGVDNMASAQKFLNQTFLTKIDARFKAMKEDYIDRLEELNADKVDNFRII